MQTIDEYLESVKPDQRAEFERIRKIVHEVAPEVTESMAYGVPTFKYKTKNLLHFGAFTKHVSIFPGPEVIETLQDKLSSYKLSKGTIQYTTAAPMPKALVIELLQAGVSSIDT